MGIVTNSSLRNAKGTEKAREMRVDECLDPRITLKSGKTMKKWLLRYTDANGKA